MAKANGNSQAAIGLTLEKLVAMQQAIGAVAYRQQEVTGLVIGGGGSDNTPSAGPAPNAADTMETETTETEVAPRPPAKYRLTPEQKARRANPSQVRYDDLRPGDVITWDQVPRATCTLPPESRGGGQWNAHFVKDDGRTITKSFGSFKGTLTPLNGTGVALLHPFSGETITAKPKVKGGISWDSVILPDDHKRQIRDAISQVHNHDLIFDKWGFGEIFEKGTAISLLFYGPPGTGKTLIGQAIADEFGYKLQIIGTAEIETPEPGGAERNMNKYFADAEKNNTILLFDECDSLITDRTNVGMIVAAQINNLLSQLEKFKGIAIFTTNRLGSLDPAFERRLSLKLEFTMPTAADRVKIWKRMFPAKAPLAKDIRWADLAIVPIAGGHIKNVVLRAARAAAAAGLDKITDDIIWDALEKEVTSAEAMQDAIAGNSQFYGTPINGRRFSNNTGRPGRL